MKGRTRCPECKHEFVLDVSAENDKHEAICPECETKFTIRTKTPFSNNGEECFWEEHGEPRKTILSSIKPHTNKPKIIAIILLCVFLIGISTAVYSEAFIESTMDVASAVGIKGKIEIHIVNQTNKSINDVNIKINGVKEIKNMRDGVFRAENVEVGITKIKISSNEYGNISQEVLILPFIKTYQQIRLNEDKEDKINNYDSSGYSIILFIFSVFALLGAIACFKRRHFDVAVVGCIVSIFSLGFFMIGSILGIIAFVLIIKSKDEFDDGKKGKVF